jgi:hypothetical protein
MKFTSIVLAALVAATQFSSTVATIAAGADIASTIESRGFVIIDIIANDIDSNTNAPIQITGSSGNALITQKINTFDATGASIVLPSGGNVDFSTTDGTLAYTPKAGFSGDDTFMYSYVITGPSAAPVSDTLVTVTVLKQEPLSFFQPKAISTFDAVGSVRGGLFNVADFTPAAPNAASLTALLNPVTDIDNFSANTSFEVVTKSFNALFVTFFGIFRGGN